MQAHDVRYRQRWHTGSPSGARGGDARVIIPEDIVVLEVHTPYFNCGDRGPCRHRPWMLGS